jgi:hypothetical protein
MDAVQSDHEYSPAGEEPIKKETDMPRPDKSSRGDLKAKLARLKKLARATAELSIEVLGDIINGNSVPVPPKPKKAEKAEKIEMVTMSSVPQPPKPKLEAIVDVAHGARTIEESLPALDPEE